MSDPLEKELKLLEAELSEFSGQLLAISRELLKEKFTVHPIFIAHQAEVHLGQLLLNKEEYDVPFSLSVSTLEEFTETGLIEKNRLRVFREAFGDPLKAMCVFWIHGDSGRYILFPFGGRSTDKEP